MTTLVRFTVVVPSNIEAELVETLLRLEPPVDGFSAVRVEGHGQDFSRATLAERVRGRTAGVMMILILPRDRVDDVIGDIRAVVGGAQCAWWTEAIERFGRFG